MTDAERAARILKGPTLVVAIDPGVNGCGVALYVNRELATASYVELNHPELAKGSKAASAARGLAPLVALIESYRKLFEVEGLTWLVIERPQDYSGPQRIADPQDLADLTLVVGAIVGACEPLFMEVWDVLPARWKGQVPKEIMHDRAKACLTETELASINLPSAAKTLGHNVWDAVALGLWFHARRKDVQSCP